MSPLTVTCITNYSNSIYLGANKVIIFSPTVTKSHFIKATLHLIHRIISIRSFQSHLFYFILFYLLTKPEVSDILVNKTDTQLYICKRVI
jgi:hypothetical protein